MPIWIRWRIDSDRGTVLQGLQEWPRGDVKRGMTRGNVRSGSKAEPAASAPSGGLSDRQIEGGHYQVECDELQGNAPAHQPLAGDCAPSPHHVPEAE